MELPSPSTFIYTLLRSPLSPPTSHASTVQTPQKILASLFLIHYSNRALISPLRTPLRSSSNMIVLLAGILFNLVNAFLLGSYLSDSRIILEMGTKFWLGVGLWGVGLVGNVLHDEVLIGIRRAKVRENSNKMKEEGKARKGIPPSERYAVPYGGLYALISYPNYFCEWIEWLGFAIAATSFASSSAHSFFSALSAIFSTRNHPLATPLFATYPLSLIPPVLLTPPWLFLSAEFFTMIGRAYRGHLWYRKTFKDYPRGRRAVIPFLF